MSELAAWSDFERREPDLSGRVLARFAAHRHAVLATHRHAVLATLRADGSPRLSGLEAPIRDGHLWLAMMPDSRKAADLRRDPRFSLHGSLDDEDVPAGDARVDGRAMAAGDAEVAVFVAGHRMAIEDPATMALFTARLDRVVLTRVLGDELLIESWTPSGGRYERSRRQRASPVRM